MTRLGEFSGQWFVHSLGWTLLHFCWQGALVAMLLWCVLVLLRQHSSQVRYGAAGYALGLLIALPVVTFVHLGLRDYRAAMALKNMPPDIDSTFALQVGSGPANATWVVRLAAGFDHSVPWIFLAWMAGAAVFLVRLNIGLFAARRIRSLTVEPAAGELQEMFAALGRRLNVQRPVKLLTSALVQVPTVIGWLRPVVLIPLSCFTGLSNLQVEAILSHELAHVRRHDYLMSVIQSVVEALLFYHPAVWWVSNQMRRERECCCDDVAVKVGGNVLEYARALKTLEERRSLYPEVALGVNGGVLTMRIKRLLGCTETSGASQLASIALLVILVVAGCASIGKFAYGQGSIVEASPAVVTHTQAVAESGAAQTAEAQSKAAQTTLLQLNQLDAIRPELEKQLVDTDRLTAELQKQLSAGVMTKEMQAQLQKQAAEAQGLHAADQKRLAEAMRQLHLSLDKLNSPEMQKQLDVTKAAVARLNSPEFRKQMEEAEMAAKNALERNGESRKQLDAMLNSPEFKKQIDEAAKAAVDSNTPDFHKQLEEARRAAERVNTPEFRRQMNSLVAENEKIVRGSGAPPMQAAGGSGPVRVSGGVMAGNRISGPNPVYPPDAKAARIQGAVVLHTVISKTGTVENLQVVSGPDKLAASALDAVRQWQYKPYLLNGQPTEVETTINVNFSLGSDSPSTQDEQQPNPPATSSGDGAVRISGGVAAGNLIAPVSPVYPPEAKAAHIQGAVVLHATISKAGIVENLQVVSGPDELQSSAMDAVKKWTYKPYLLNGEPTEVQTTITVNYTLSDPAQDQGENRGDASIPVRKIGGSVSAPLVISQVSPEMTPESKKAKFKGTVLVNLLVDTKGMPQDVHVVRGAGMGLDEKAMDAVKQYKFKPAMEAGIAVPVKVNIEVNFQVF